MSTRISAIIFCGMCFALMIAFHGESRANDQRAKSCCQRVAEYNLLMEDVVKLLADGKADDPKRLTQHLIQRIYGVPEHVAARAADEILLKLERSDGM